MIAALSIVAWSALAQTPTPDLGDTRDPPPAASAPSPSSGPSAPVGDGPLAGMSIAVMKTEVGGDIDPAVGPQVTARVADALRTRANAKVISSDEIIAMLQNEKQRAILGSCSTDSCLSELASALGAETIVSTKLVKVEGQLALSISMLNGASANVLARVSETWGGDPLVLLALVAPCVDKMIAQVSGAPTPTGSLDVVNATDGTKILVDDAVKGTAPAGQMGGVPIGAHKVTLLHDDKKPFEKWVVVERDQVASLAAQQEELDPAFYETWWFWTAAGAGVLVVGAAAAATTVYLLAGGNPGQTGVNVSVNADKKLGGPR